LEEKPCSTATLQWVSDHMQ